MLLDVSQPVTARTAAFPGDQPFACGWSLRLDRGESCNLSSVTASPHVGTHVDAPFHYDERGARVGGLDLDAFVGPCVVVDAMGRDAIDADALRGVDLASAPRVLFKTAARSDPTQFRREFPLLAEGAIEMLSRAGVRLVGMDAPSFDAVDAKELRIHRALGLAGIANVENLVLDNARAGRYHLMAAPVAWVEQDAAPLRALLQR